MVKIGLEIHQRLNTGKLFCRCPGKLELPLDFDPLYRELRAIKSELSEEDLAAKMQEQARSSFVYLRNRVSSCLVELDEEPPHLPNKTALLVALNVAQQMQMLIFPKLLFMRKMIVDGSNVSGFQRTGLLAVDGEIRTPSGSIGIQSLALEEESAGILGPGQFRLDRLGIPLIEIVTEPTIKDGKHCREVAEQIGLLLRSTGYAARGIGTIRQDLNISIEGGARVEIKGAQDLAMLPKWVENEIKRQEDLIALLPSLSSLPKVEEMPVDVSNILSGAKAPFIRKALASGSKALAIRVAKHAGLLGRKVGLRRYGSEVSDYAKMAGVGGIIHSDEDLNKYGIDGVEVKNALGCNEDDAFIIVIAEEKKARKALAFAVMRLNMRSVPKETRKALPDGGSSFLRPLPGRARMYPETDVPAIDVSSLLEEAMGLVEPFEKKLARISSMLNEELAYKILKGRNLALFEELAAKTDPKVVAVTLEDTTTKLRRELGKEPSEDSVRKALELYAEGKITKKAIERAIKMLEQGKTEEEIIAEIGKITGKELKELVAQTNNLGEIMKKYGLRVEADEVKELLKS